MKELEGPSDEEIYNDTLERFRAVTGMGEDQDEIPDPEEEYDYALRLSGLNQTDKPLTPRQYVDLIDFMYHHCRIEKVGRVDNKWGLWSTAMNRETRKRIEDKDPKETELKYVFMYWQGRSQQLELAFTASKFYGQNKRKQKAKEVREIKNIIFSGVGLKDIESPFDILMKGGAPNI